MKRVAIALVVLLLAAAGAAAAFVVYREHQSRNIRGSPSVEFATTRQVEAKVPKTAKIAWPMFGFDGARTRAVASRARPPYRVVWSYKAKTLIEFPPSIGYGRLFFVTNAGLFVVVDAKTGQPVYRTRMRRCAASTPAIAGGLVFATFMNPPPCNSALRHIDGKIVAFSAHRAKIVWSRRIGPSESSPLVANGLVYVGDWRGIVYALDTATGRIRWHFRAHGKVKGGLALAGGRVYVGSYDNHVYALDARTGRLVWKASAQQRLGNRGSFYSTPTVAYGRVYIGGTDGKVYSFGARTGKLRWSQGTGGYVYGSPAVWHERILVGSYSGWFSAFDAATGDVRWRFKAKGPISGSATVLGDLVYFATLKHGTYALDARTGKVVWRFHDGEYSPIVADRQHVYLLGHQKVYALAPRGAR